MQAYCPRNARVSLRLARLFIVLWTATLCVGGRVPADGEPCGPSFVDRVPADRMSRLWASENIHRVAVCVWRMSGTSRVPPQCCCVTARCTTAVWCQAAALLLLLLMMLL